MFFRLSNLFHGMDETTPVRYSVFCGLIKVAATCNAIAFIPTDLDQVRICYHANRQLWQQGNLTLSIQRHVFSRLERFSSLILIFFSQLQWSSFKPISKVATKDFMKCFGDVFVGMLRFGSGSLTGTSTQRRSTHSSGWCMRHWWTVKKGKCGMISAWPCGCICSRGAIDWPSFS